MMYRLGIVLLCIVFVIMVLMGPIAPPAHGVVISTVVVGTVLAAMAAAGIGLTVSGMTASQISDWVGGKLSSWATSLGGSVQDHIDNSLIGVTTSGIISVGTAAAAGISDFISWLVGNQSLTDNDVVSVISSGAVSLPTVNYVPTAQQIVDNGLTIYYGPGTIKSLCYSADNANVAIAVYIVAGLVSAVAASTSIGVVAYQSINSDLWGNQALNHYDNDRGIYYSNPIEVRGWDTGLPVNESRADTMDALADYLGGTSQSLTITTGTITVPTIDTTTQDKWYIDVGAAPGSTIETVTDGVIADTIDGDLTVSDEIAEDDPEFIVDEPIAISGLSEVFPFCIPFDVYALLSCLSADPVTPVFTARFVVPGIINQEFSIDLTPFNNVAQIVRTMELLAFIVGLALVTRERFLRS